MANTTTTDVTSISVSMTATTSLQNVTLNFTNGMTTGGINNTNVSLFTTTGYNSTTTTATVFASENVGAIVVAVVLTLIALSCFILNILVMFVFVRVRAARKVNFYFVFELAIVDIVAAVLWTVMALVSVSGVNITPACDLQAVMMSTTSMLTMYTLFVLNFERCVKLIKPSKHYEIFGVKTVTFLIMISLIIYCVTVSILPLIGWGKYLMFANQYQCSWDFQASYSHQTFILLVGYVVPFCGCIVCQTISLLKAKKIRTQVQPGDQIILEEDKDVPKLTYADKLKRMENKFKFSTTKKRKMNRRNKTNQDSSSSSSDSDDDTSEKRYQEKQKKRRRQYKFKHDDFKLAVTFIILTVLNFVCWLPYFIVGYVWVVPGYSTVGDAIIGLVTCLCHLTIVLKPIIYCTNSHLRKLTRQAFRSQKEPSDDSDIYREKERHEKKEVKPEDDDSDKNSSRRSSVSSANSKSKS